MYDKFDYECPFGGDISNDCADCVYSSDYHFDKGDCVEREYYDEPDYNEDCGFDPYMGCYTDDC